MDREIDDLLPDLDLGTALRQRPLGLGSVRHVLLITVAVTASWALAEAVSGSTMALFAPVTTLLVVQSSAWTTLGLSVQRIVGTGIGVAVASLWVNLAGLTWWSFLLAVGASLLIARALPFSLGGQLQIPVAVVFVMALGPGTVGADLWRVADVFIGGAVGLIAVFAFPSRPRREPLEESLRVYRDAIATTLRAVGEESGTLAEPLAAGVPHSYVQGSRGLRDRADAAREQLVRFVEASHLNPRGRGQEEYIVGQAVRLRRLTGMALQVRGIVGEANRLYDRADTSPALAGDRLGALVEQVLDLMSAVMGGPGEPLGLADRDGATRRAADLEEGLREAADVLASRHGGVGTVLPSVTLLGRLDLVRVQLEEFRRIDAQDAREGEG